MTFNLVGVLGGNLSQKNMIDRFEPLAPFFPASHWAAEWVLINDYYHRHFEYQWFNPGMKVIVDSGGYQLKSLYQKEPLDPKKIMEGQNKIADIAIGLDEIPVPRAEGDKTTFTAEYMNRMLNEGMNPSFFRKCAERTAEHMHKMIEVKAPGVKLYVPIHGSTYEQRKIWLDIVEKDHTFDGLCHKSSSYFDALSTCAFQHDVAPDRPFHMLGVGLLLRSFPFIYWSRHHKQMITADTTSWAQGIMHRIYYSPIMGFCHALKSPTRENDNNGGRDIVWKYKGLPCDCVFCSKASRYNFDDQEFAIIMSSHNLLHMIERTKRFEAMIQYPEVFIRHAEEIVKEEESTSEISWDKGSRLTIARMVEALDLIPEKGGQYVVSRFAHLGRTSLEEFF